MCNDPKLNTEKTENAVNYNARLGNTLQGRNPLGCEIQTYNLKLVWNCFELLLSYWTSTIKNTSCYSFIYVPLFVFFALLRAQHCPFPMGTGYDNAKRETSRKKGKPRPKNSFRFFWVLFFRGLQTVNRPCWAHMTAMHSFIVRERTGAGSMGAGKWSERTLRGAFCVWRHNQQYFECFLCKVRRFFLSDRACCFSLVVFAVRRWMRDCSNFRGLFQRLPIEFC